ncbi:hypothetical protein CPB85DRAFT_1568023 [Mucidula mucida]|nr:hypothetical protein CPB85DRAFT_1568023 [Mucidula mucida]
MSPARNAADQALVFLTCSPRKSLAEQLPMELISLIASILARPSEDSASHMPYSLYHLVLATHVCHRWREVISSDPRLWTDIQFSVPNFWWPYASDILAKVLPLSGSLAFKISAGFLESDPALTQILNFSTRCDSLTLILPYDLYCELSREVIASPDSSQNSVTSDGQKFWEGLVALQELTLENSSAEWVSLPASGRCLETVQRDDHECHLSRDVLRSGLGKLWANRNMEVVVKEKIKTLCLKDYGVRLLHYVSCPALRTFSVDMRRWDSDDILEEITENIMQSVIDFLAQANPPLENITLGADEFPLYALPLVLRAVPHLKSFNLHVDLFSDLSFLTEFFDELLAKKRDGAFEAVPVLEKLSIALPALPWDRQEDLKPVDEVSGKKHFVNMVEERTAECMRSVLVTIGSGGCCSLDEEDTFALDECLRRVDGLEIIISGSGLDASAE